MEQMSGGSGFGEAFKQTAAEKKLYQDELKR